MLKKIMEAKRYLKYCSPGSWEQKPFLPRCDADRNRNLADIMEGSEALYTAKDSDRGDKQRAARVEILPKVRFLLLCCLRCFMCLLGL